MNKKYKRKILHRSSRRKKKYNNRILFPNIYKIILIVVLFSILVLISNFKVNIEDIIEKEINTLKFNQTRLNWDNLKSDLEFLSNKYRHLIKYEKIISEYSPIWIMWYQGIEKAPSIVKSCIQSVILNKANHPVHIIDKYNLEKYIKLPSYINEKFNNGTFNVVHFSDIIRMGILTKYGGYWIDSTYFINTTITKVNTSFYSLKLKTCFPHRFIKCLWSGNFLAVPKNSFIATYGYIAFLFYWKKYNSLIDYFLIDYIIDIAYQNVPEFKNFIANLPLIKCDIFALVNSLNSVYNKDNFKCPFNKLTRKRNFNSFNTIGKTNYGYIIDNYKLNTENMTYNVMS